MYGELCWGIMRVKEVYVSIEISCCSVIKRSEGATLGAPQRFRKVASLLQFLDVALISSASSSCTRARASRALHRDRHESFQ